MKGSHPFTNSSDAEYRLATTNADVYNDSLTLVNGSSGSIYTAYGSAGNQFNGNVELINDGAGIFISGPDGGVTLGSGFYFNAVSNTGSIYLRNLTQLGTTIQTISAGGTGTIEVDSCHFSGTGYFFCTLHQL